MSDPNKGNADTIADRLHQQAEVESLRITAHAHQEMVEEGISLEDLITVLHRATLLENYPDHKRGACRLVLGETGTGRFLHVVCTTSLDVAIIITVYEPKPPKWVTPLQRGKRV
jgi:hypothetical protein